MKVKIFLLLIIFLAVVLRLYKLDQNPPALYWDEASLGYNAYAISQTGRDEHGVFLPLTNFAAFGDYKPPAYIYAVVPFIKVLGLTEIAVRLPSALAGVGLTLVAFFLAKEFLNKKIGLVAALFVAVSPWSLLLSRAAFEANLATFFSAAGVLFFLKRSWAAAIFFVLAMYTFNTHRVFVPLLVVVLSLVFFRQILKAGKRFLIFYLLFFVLLIPLIPHLISPEGRLRFNEVTWLNDLSLVQEANENIISHGNTRLANIIYNRRITYAREFARHYLDHFRPDYLFSSGDVNPRLSTRSFGILYWFDLPMVLAGIYFLLRKPTKFSWIILGWILLAPIPAALARETPHALRTLNMLPGPQILAAIGIVEIINKFKANRGLKLATGAVLGLNVFLFLQNYFYIYPKKFSGDWQYGYKQMVEYATAVQDNYDKVMVTGKYGRPYIYFLFYNYYPSEKYLANRQAFHDRFGFWTVAGFDKYVFANSSDKQGRILYVRAPEEGPAGTRLISTIYDLENKPVFNLYD